MHRRDIIVATIAAGLSTLAIQPVWAQNKRAIVKPGPPAVAPVPPAITKAPKIPRTPIDEFETMPTEQRQQVLNQLSRSERDKLQKRLAKFNALPAEQQQALKNLYNRLHQLPPEQEETVRKAINRFSSEPIERQRAIREELQKMAALSSREREQRLATTEFRKKYSRKEQGIIRDMNPLLTAE